MITHHFSTLAASTVTGHTYCLDFKFRRHYLRELTPILLDGVNIKPNICVYSKIILYRNTRQCYVSIKSDLHKQYKFQLLIIIDFGWYLAILRLKSTRKCFYCNEHTKHQLKITTAVTFGVQRSGILFSFSSKIATEWTNFDIATVTSELPWSLQLVFYYILRVSSEERDRLQSAKRRLHISSIITVMSIRNNFQSEYKRTLKVVCKKQERDGSDSV